MSELKVFESRRKQALLSIVVLHLLFLSFQHSQLFKGLINSNRIESDIYGKINGVDICFSNILAELELKHDWTNFLDIIFFMVRRYETIIQSNIIYLFVFSLLRVLS